MKLKANINLIRFLSDILIADVIPSICLKKNGKSELNFNLSKQFLYLKHLKLAYNSID